jgi:hypothetical protein
MTAWYECGPAPLERLRRIVNLAGARGAVLSPREAYRQELTACRVLELLSRDRGAVIADDVGMGKTYEALAVASLALARGTHHRVVVVTPRPPVRRKWEKDLAQFATCNIVDAETRRMLELSLLGARIGDDAPLAAGEAAATDGRGVAGESTHGEYMSRLVEDAERDGIIFVHQHQLAPTFPGPAQSGFLLSRALRAYGCQTRTVKKLVRKAGFPVPSHDDVPGWLVRAADRASDLRPELGRFVGEWRAAPDPARARDVCNEFRWHLLRAAIGKADLLVVDEAHTLKATSFGRAVRRVFADVDRRLFLSATPFQVSVDEIDEMVNVLWDGASPAELQGLGARLGAFIGAKDELDERWNAVPPEQVAAAADAIRRGGAPANALAPVKEVASAWSRTLDAKERAAAALGRFVVRSVRKEKAEYRVLFLGDPDPARTTRGRVDDDGLMDRAARGVPILPHDVVVLATERLLAELRRSGDDRTFVAQIRQNATSSYGALRKWLDDGLRDGDGGPRFLDGADHATASCARVLSRMLPSKNDARSVHPKVRATAHLAATHALDLGKTLVFTGRRQTASEVAAQVNRIVDERLLRHVPGHAATAPERRQRLRRELLGNGLLSLAVRENPVRTILPRLAGLPEVPPECRRIDDELLDAAGAAFGHDGLDAEGLLLAVSAVILRRLEGDRPALLARRLGALSDGERALLEVVRSRGARPGRASPRRRRELGGLLGFLLEGPDLFAPWAPILRPLSLDERRLFERAAAAVVSHPILVSRSVPVGGGTWGIEVLEAVAAGLQEVALRIDRALERVLAGGAGTRGDRLRVIVELLGAKKAEHVAAALVEDDVKAQLRRDAFNLPFGPYVVVATPRFGEGIDLHRECSRVVHHDAHWNPAVLEQRTGRVDRIHSRTAREGCALEVYLPFVKGSVDEQILRRAFERASWYDALLGGTRDASVLKQVEDAGDEDAGPSRAEVEGTKARRRFPWDLARRLEIDLAPEVPSGGEPPPAAAPSPYAPDRPSDAAPPGAAARRILTGLEPAQVHVSHGAEDSIVLECRTALVKTLRVEALVSATDVSFISGASRVRVSSREDALRERIVFALADLVAAATAPAGAGAVSGRESPAA